jgi:MFS family permease
MMEPAPARTRLLDPLRSRLFLMIWIANMASNIGTQIQSVGEKWQMAHLTTSPLLIALIETGTTLPVLLLGLAAGAFADILDRRKLLITTQMFMLGCAAALSGLTFLHQITPMVLLTMSFLIGTGSALSMPAFQAIVPELLDREHLVGGIALNSGGLSRAVGPAVGGLIVGLMGAGWAFCFNAVSFLAVVVALVAWKRRPPTSSLPGERFLGALKVGFRYARHSRTFQVILLRALGYSWFAGVIFSLLPTLAIHDLKLGSEAFGALAGFSLLAALAQGVIAYVPHTPTVAFCLFCSGMSWVVILSTVNTAIQLSVPPWVKARAFGTYHTVWGGAMRWALFEEPDQPQDGTVRFLETYLSTTMGEHLRQHHHATAQDRAVLAGAYILAEGGRPITRHLVVVEDHDSSLLHRIWQGWLGE